MKVTPASINEKMDKKTNTVSRVVEFIEMENQMVVSGGWGEGRWGVV